MLTPLRQIVPRAANCPFAVMASFSAVKRVIKVLPTSLQRPTARRRKPSARHRVTGRLTAVTASLTAPKSVITASRTKIRASLMAKASARHHANPRLTAVTASRTALQDARTVITVRKTPIPLTAKTSVPLPVRPRLTAVIVKSPTPKNATAAIRTVQALTDLLDVRTSANSPRTAATVRRTTRAKNATTA